MIYHNMQLFIIDGPLGACCDTKLQRRKRASLKIARTPTIISYIIKYSWSDLTSIMPLHTLWAPAELIGYYDISVGMKIKTK